MKTVTQIITVIVVVRLAAINKSKTSEEASQTRATAVMVCIHSVIVLVCDSVYFVLGVLFGVSPNLDACDPYEKQFIDFATYWPNRYSTVVQNALDTLKVGFYFFPAFLFHASFRHELSKALRGCTG